MRLSFVMYVLLRYDIFLLLLMETAAESFITSRPWILYTMHRM